MALDLNEIRKSLKDHLNAQTPENIQEWYDDAVIRLYESPDNIPLHECLDDDMKPLIQPINEHQMLIQSYLLNNYPIYYIKDNQVFILNINNPIFKYDNGLLYLLIDDNWINENQIYLTKYKAEKSINS